MGRASGWRVKRVEYHRSAVARSLTVDWASTRWMAMLSSLVLGAELIASVVTTLLWLVATLAFRYYVQNFGSYNKTYGTIGGVIVLLTWMYLSMVVVLIGGELAAELMKGTGGVRSRAGFLYDGRISNGGPTDAPSVRAVDRGPEKPGRSRGDRGERPAPAGGVAPA